MEKSVPAGPLLSTREDESWCPVSPGSERLSSFQDYATGARRGLHLLPEQLWVDRDDGEGPVMHGDHSVWCKHLDRFYGVVDAHREIAADGEKCDVQRVQAADELHVEKHARVTGMIDRPFSRLDDKAAGIPRVNEVAVLGHRGAVQSLRQEEFTEWEDVIATDVHGMHIRNPFACKVSDEFRRADDCCSGAPGDGDCIAHVIGVAMGHEDVGWMNVIGTDGCRGVAREEWVNEDVAGRRGDQESRMTKIGVLLMCHGVMCLSSV